MSVTAPPSKLCGGNLRKATDTAEIRTVTAATPHLDVQLCKDSMCKPPFKPVSHRGVQTLYGSINADEKIFAQMLFNDWQ